VAFPIKVGRLYGAVAKYAKEYFQNESTQFTSRRLRGNGFEDREAVGSQLTSICAFARTEEELTLSEPDHRQF
jgi:hypothetical protein